MANEPDKHTVIVIDVAWDGPFNFNEVRTKNTDKDKDCGLYQIYGRHEVFGENALLYIGKTEENSFAGRISAHKKWIDQEYSNVTIFLGRLIWNRTNSNWKNLVDYAERLLIYTCSPPYNKQCIDSYGEMKLKDTLVLNLYNRNRLPREVSTFFEERYLEGQTTEWKAYGVKKKEQ